MLYINKDMINSETNQFSLHGCNIQKRKLTNKFHSNLFSGYTLPDIQFIRNHDEFSCGVTRSYYGANERRQISYIRIKDFFFFQKERNKINACFILFSFELQHSGAGGSPSFVYSLVYQGWIHGNKIKCPKCVSQFEKWKLA